MPGCACTARCRITASYGRKLVDTMARPWACATAQRTISKGDLVRSSAFQRFSSAEVMTSEEWLGPAAGQRWAWRRFLLRNTSLRARSDDFLDMTPNMLA